MLNRANPENVLKLHADEYQLKRLLEAVHPGQVCFFHQHPEKMTPVRSWIEEDYPNVKKTFAFSKNTRQVIKLNEN